MSNGKPPLDPVEERAPSPPLDGELKELLHRTANTIRGLAIDGVQKANSGHPGLPMGCAELGAYLFGVALRHNPHNPHWLGRDRLILSAGHGSMWLYSCLHLAGFDLTMQDLENFRQLYSRTPGHPEAHLTAGVESTTGPLGQGLANAVGQALGLKLLRKQFGDEEFPLFNGKVYCLMGDGCLMEGITSEVSSLAGHLQLDNLIVIHDANQVSLDGPLSDCCSENSRLRYEAYGWTTYEVDGHDLDGLHRVIGAARQRQTGPVFIEMHTVIGQGSPNKSGSNASHGAPLGKEEVQATKAALGLPQDNFWVPEQVYSFFKERALLSEEWEARWHKDFDSWAKRHPDQLDTFEKMRRCELPNDLEQQLIALKMPSSMMAGRKASHLVLQKLAELLPQLIGGSADLSCSDLTMLDRYPVVAAGEFLGRNIKFGVREFGMAAMATGLAQTGMFLPFVGTFLTFSDYMRNAIRLAALMRQRVIYQFTHDSIFLGEDGPTHQPVEQYAALRAIPHLRFMRPADANEVKGCWLAALRYPGPTAIALSRQPCPTLAETELPFSEGVGRGGYLVRKEAAATKPDYTLFATGSELSLAIAVADELARMDKQVRVISMPCWELFEEQSREYQEELVGGQLGKRVSIEAGVAQGWHKYIGRDGIAISQEEFGASAPYQELKDHFGFTVDAILERII